MMRGTLFLGGGGSEVDEGRLWAEAFPPGAAVAVWPFAQSGEAARRSAGEWVASSLASLGEFTVETWISPADGDRSLRGVDVIAIPGGNTFGLLHELRSAQLLPVLREHLRQGGNLYGGSAGAVLAGADIGIARAADPNDVGLENTAGLDCLQGSDVLPHYTADQLSAVQEHVRTTGRSVVCLPERGGVVVPSDGTIRNAGPDDVWVVSAASVQRWDAGARWVLGSGERDEGTKR